MEPTVKPDDRGDAIDREKFREMLESPAFARLRTRIVQETSRALTECATSDSRREIHRAQGAAAMGNTILRMPDIILEEMNHKGPPKKR